MKYQEIARKFKEKQINIFSTADFENIASLCKESAWAALGRYVKMGLIKCPKRGLYYFTDSPPDTYLLANKIYIPSYVSFETALSYHSVIPEAVYAVTCATTKTTREFDNGDTTFAYYKIKTQAFTGYYKREGYLIADPEKALTDYLYFVALGKKTLNDRLNTNRLHKSEILRYARLFNNQKLDKIVASLAAFAAKKHMIQEKEIERLVVKSQTSKINVYREYCQHLFLSYLYRQKGAGNVLFFKGGTALKLIYGSPRFSEDLDFSSPGGNVDKIESIIVNALKEIEHEAIKIDITESKKTIGGYLAIVDFNLAKHKVPLKIEVSFREKKVKGEVASIASEFVPPYTLIIFPKKDIVGQKIQALLTRAKPRDFYDLYFLMRAGFLGKEEKDNLEKILTQVQKTEISFKKELQQFLPKSHWVLIKDFKNALIREIERFTPLFP